jgi:ADP-ribose pyrophosphatase YjhB (NUDIX family)
MTDKATSAQSKPTLRDRAFQLAYVCAYRGMRLYWGIAHPTTEGALVALWHGGEVLLVRNSYVPYYSLPGGYIRRGEAPADAVIRELGEEVGITAKAADLALAFDHTHEWEGKSDHVRIFNLEVPVRPEVKVDHREVIEAAWWAPDRALALNLFPPLRTVLSERIRPKGA